MKGVILVSVSLSALLAGYFWFFADEAEPVAPVNTAPSFVAQPETMEKAQEKRSKAAEIHVDEKVPEPISDSFKLLASAYAAELDMPSYSRPLTEADEQLLNPNRYFVQSVPLVDGGSVAIILPKYRFSYPEPIMVSLQISGIRLFDVSVQLQNDITADVTDSYPMLGTAQQVSATLPAESDWNGGFEVQVSFTANGQTQVVKTGIEYYNPVAIITGVGESLGVGPDMQIPVLLDVKQPGFYRLRANLYTEQRMPLALLTANAKLGSGQQEIVLRAFKAVLQQYNGPYVLGSFVLEKRPATPGETTQYGEAERAEYPLEYFSLQQLSDEPWQPDEQEQQRLRFLQQMATQN